MDSITTRVALGVLTTRHPATGKVIGKRLVASHINRAQYDMRSGDYVQSHAPRYRIVESGDYTNISMERMERWIEQVSKLYKLKF